MYVGDRKTDKEAGLTSKYCVEVGVINAPGDVVKWVYAQRFEWNILETWDQS